MLNFWTWIKERLDADAGKKRVAAGLMLVGAAVGLLASLVLSIESLVLARHVDAVLSCDLNAAVSCTAVANHWSAELLGFPNAFIGLATLPVMVTVAVALLARVKFPRWFMIGAQLGATAGLVFAGWMLYMSVFVIQILCPWCLTLDVGMILLLYGLSRHNILNGIITGKSLKNFVNRGYDTLILAILLAIIALVTAEKLINY